MGIECQAKFTFLFLIEDPMPDPRYLLIIQILLFFSYSSLSRAPQGGEIHGCQEIHGKLLRHRGRLLIAGNFGATIGARKRGVTGNKPEAGRLQFLL